jgi:glutamate-1-semialdehyde 2,1-aminomutase/spore coat polysaccharide biosynthesis protein SpsF
MTTIIGIVQARCSSTRLPNKVLLPILGEPSILHLIRRAQNSRLIQKLILATSIDRSDDNLAALCKQKGIYCYRGSLDDVLARFYHAALPYQPDHIVRLTGDCPLVDPSLIDQVIELHLNTQVDYTSNALPPSYPDGFDVEVVKWSALEKAYQQATLASDREHVMPYIYHHPEQFKLSNLMAADDWSRLRCTVDHIEDFTLINKIFDELQPKNVLFGWGDVIELLQSQPTLVTLNQHYVRNAGYAQSIANDAVKKLPSIKPIIPTPGRYKKSEQWLAYAQKLIPLGSQTFSKSITQFPFGVSPYFAERADGAFLWDIDGNQYLDFINSLASVTLGYNRAEIISAVQQQLGKGTIFSLSNRLEAEVAELIYQLVPCAEQVRFGKNGSDATSAAIRLARAYTGREYVACCGYHGWHDWYIGSTSRHLGVPASIQGLTKTFTYNQFDTLEQIFNEHPKKIAAVILEPMNLAYPESQFLENIRKLCDQQGTLLIFDETITGFRFANGGAQALFGVTPDLACFGKGLANGYPLSAVVGRQQIMSKMADIFFSGTFGGELLSLAAAKTVLTLLQSQPILQNIAKTGSQLMQRLETVIKTEKMQDHLQIVGHPSWSFLSMQAIDDWDVFAFKTYWLQSCFARGILTLGTHNMSAAHNEDHITQLIGTYEEILQSIRYARQMGDLPNLLACPAIKPLFKVR